MIKMKTHPRGFTLLEMLIVVGLVALLSVGIAGVFGTVGETISRGRRVSELNRSAAQMERVMRADFNRMSREGFLVIRNEYANRGQPVSLFDPSLYEGEPSPRPRRIDEIMFFARNDTGQFETARVPMHPDMIASSDSARIYYGHGKKRIRPIVTNNNATTRRCRISVRRWMIAMRILRLRSGLMPLVFCLRDNGIRISMRQIGRCFGM